MFSRTWDNTWKWLDATYNCVCGLFYSRTALMLVYYYFKVEMNFMCKVLILERFPNSLIEWIILITDKKRHHFIDAVSIFAALVRMELHHIRGEHHDNNSFGSVVQFDWPGSVWPTGSLSRTQCFLHLSSCCRVLEALLDSAVQCDLDESWRILI